MINGSHLILRIFLALALSSAWLNTAHAAIGLIVSTSQASVDGSNITTPAINTTGASLLIVYLIHYNATTPTMTLSDSKGNTWVPTWTAIHPTSTFITMSGFYVAGGTVGTGHSFTASGISTVSAMTVAAYQGTRIAGVRGTPAGPAYTSASSLSPGTLIPGIDGALMTTAIGRAGDTSGDSIDSGFGIKQNVPYVGGMNFGISLADKIQTTAANETPTWSWTSAATGIAMGDVWLPLSPCP